ncbi:MAG: hypothetical protein ACD_47C00045G0003 [uncultured bacterium]|nr:MAG: hypothetical protein ACD_47C00045G0003 [uncultured bacterium]
MEECKFVYRRSRQRQKILDLIKCSGDHPGAMQIYNSLKEEMPSLSLGTVYRNLNILLEQGLIHKVPFNDSCDRFDAKLESHFHLICEKCGSIEDIFLPCLSDIDREAAKSKKFKITRHRIDFYGVCEKCRKNK